MKKILSAVALSTMALTASATTLGLDYSYGRATGSTPYLASHVTVASVKHAIGSFGNVKLGLGTVQGVSNGRDNGNLFGAEYSYDFQTRFGQLTPTVGLAYISGLEGGSLNAYSLGGTLRTPVGTQARLVTSLGYSSGYNGVDASAPTLGVGVELDIMKNVVLKGGYEYARLSLDNAPNRNMNVINVGVEYKF